MNMQSKAELDAFCARCEHRGETMCGRNEACAKCKKQYECIKICVKASIYLEEIQTGKKFAEPPRRYI